MPETVVGVFSDDTNDLTASLLQSLEDEALAITVERAASEKQLYEWVDEGQIDVGALSLPIGETCKARVGRSYCTVAGQESNATIIRQIFDTFAITANTIAVSTEILMTEAAAKSAAGEEIDIQALHEGLSASMQSVVNETKDYVTETSVGEQSVSAMQYYAAAMAAMFLLFNAMVGGKSFHRERQTETLARLMMTPTSLRSILDREIYRNISFRIFSVYGLHGSHPFSIECRLGSERYADILHRGLLLHCRFRVVDGDGSLYDG